jgi:hypothetical protein
VDVTEVPVVFVRIPNKGLANRVKVVAPAMVNVFVAAVQVVVTLVSERYPAISVAFQFPAGTVSVLVAPDKMYWTVVGVGMT